MIMETFSGSNNMRIDHTFFDDPLKYIWFCQVTRGKQSVFDCLLTDRTITPQQIIDIRTLNRANIGSDNKLLLCKLRLQTIITHRKDNDILQNVTLNIRTLHRFVSKINENKASTKNGPAVQH